MNYSHLTAASSKQQAASSKQQAKAYALLSLSSKIFLSFVFSPLVQKDAQGDYFIEHL